MILLSVTGLELFGQLAHDLWKHGWRAQNDIALRIAFLKNDNWSAHNPDWLTNVIPFKGESVTYEGPAGCSGVRDAHRQVPLGRASPSDRGGLRSGFLYFS